MHPRLVAVKAFRCTMEIAAIVVGAWCVALWLLRLTYGG